MAAGIGRVALACDYDGTLAENGVVAPETIAQLERLRRADWRLVLVTGRQLPDLRRVCPALRLFARVVAENGAVLFDPAGGHDRTLGEPPPRRFVDALRERGVAPLGVGRVVVATVRPHERTVAETIRRHGLTHRIIFNNDAVMVLPAGVDKAAGLRAAFAELRLTREQAVAVGDAENDRELLAACGFGVAVANAVSILIAEADFVMREAAGAGVRALIDCLLNDSPGARPEPDHGSA